MHAPNISIKQTVDEWKEQLGESRSLSDVRLEKFADVFEKEFSDNSYVYGSASALSWVFMEGAIMLWSLGMAAPALIELYIILERWTVVTASAIFAPHPKSLVIRDLIQWARFEDIAKKLAEDKILGEEDVDYVSKLTKKRNALVHRNIDKNLG